MPASRRGLCLARDWTGFGNRASLLSIVWHGGRYGEAFILQANIVRFRDLLVICNDPTQRRTIERLLGDAIHRLKRLEGGRGRPKSVSAEMKHGKTHIPAGPDRQPSGS
jgi:hypothetical protein